MQKGKVGIMTLFDNLNYGATLQAYALQNVVRDLGWECEDIYYYREIDGHPINEISIKIKMEQLFQRIIHIEHQLNQMLHYKKYKMAKKGALIRDKAFKRFISEKMFVSEKRFSGHKDIKDAALLYDIFICGSDNIWNKNLLDTAFFLDFVPNEKKKISYAPGMSTNMLTKEQREIILPLVLRFDFLSVREAMGKKLIEEISGRKVEQVLDPTLLLTAEQWRNIEKKVDLPFENYIFCYFFGDNEISRKCAQKLSKETNLPIVTLPMNRSYMKQNDGFGDCQLYDIDPGQFVWLIDKANYVFTDSFHGTTFSVVLEKEFFCFRRFFSEETKSLNFRIDSLLNTVGIERRIIETEDEFQPDEILNIKYTQVLDLLEKERVLSITYLKNALEE